MYIKRYSDRNVIQSVSSEFPQFALTAEEIRKFVPTELQSMEEANRVKKKARIHAAVKTDLVSAKSVSDDESEQENVSEQENAEEDSDGDLKVNESDDEEDFNDYAQNYDGDEVQVDEDVED